MSSRWAFAFTTLIVPCLFPQISSAQDEASAKQFLEKIYSNYTKKALPNDLFGPSISLTFTPSLVELIQADQKVLKGEVGFLGMDPICACQDYDISSLQLHFEPEHENGLKATATFDNLGHPTVVSLDLVPVGDQWRIDDIHSTGVDSLRRSLANEIESLKK